MLRNYFLINLILILVLSFLGFKLYETYRATAGIPLSSEIKKKKAKNVTTRRAPVFNEASYNVITQKDLFRPSRSAPDQKAEKTSEKTDPKNPPKLFGTIILENEKSAILQDSESKATKTYKLNELISGFTITEILEDKVVLVKDGENLEVKLREDKGIVTPKKQAVKPRKVRQDAKKPATKPRQRRPRRVRRNVPPPPTTAPR
jgi:hypothetical protein